MIFYSLIYFFISFHCTRNNFVSGLIEDIKQNADWIGISCCDLAESPMCKTVCLEMNSTNNATHLQQSCRPSHEPKFTSCLESRQEAERCCASVLNTTCKSICKELFKKPAKQTIIKHYSSKGCFHQIPKCLKNYAHINNNESNNNEYPKLHIHCCEKAINVTCQDKCRKLLDDYTTTTDEIHNIVDELEEACGSPIRPQSPMWSCFLQSTSSPSVSKSLIRIPLDVGKLSCCSKATRANCQKLCWRAFQSDWALAVTKLETDCLNSNMEGELRRCLEDASDSCEMGCDGLSFCSKYNNRPTSLFRSCSIAADEAARWEADSWARGGVIRGLGVLVRVAPTCPVEILRAAACLLQLRPCESHVHESRLCREDCLEIMSSCVDWSNNYNNLGNDSHGAPLYSATTLCTKLAPARSEAPCVSLKPFVQSDQFYEERETSSTTELINIREQNKKTNKEDSNEVQENDIATPCSAKNKPCPDGFICILQTGDTKTYNCVKACSLGEMSKQNVPVGSWIQIPRMEQQSCYMICQCTIQGFEKCKILNCFNINFCWVQDHFIAHRSNFYLECNHCLCFDGEVTCSRRSCGETRMASLPCDCPAHYVPVCSRMGITFASACLAKCAGLSTNDIEFGSCSSKNPCAKKQGENGVCNSDVCVPRRRVCLSPHFKPCHQYECVNVMNCHTNNAFNSSPVCDTMNRQHPSLCAMVRDGATLAYRGPCLKNCSLRGPICATNGEVYSSECAAWADKAIMDYYGPCIAVGLVSDQAKPRCGDAVICPPIVKEHCVGVTPPGSCCPICAGAARLSYSRKQLERIYHIMNEQEDKDIVMLESMINALRRQMQVSQCNLHGMISPEGDIFIINQAITKNPSELQLKACITEVEKLVTRITERSPRIVTEVPLSSLTRAEITHSYIFSHANSLVISIQLMLFSITITMKLAF